MIANSFSPDSVVWILKKAYESGIIIFIEDEKVKVRTSKDVEISKEIIDSLRSRKDEIFHFLKTEKFDIARKITAFDRTAVHDIPLSYSQERLWFIDQLEGSIHYHIPAVLRFVGKLDKDMLENAFRQVVNRHESLRSCFIEKDGRPFQYIIPENQWSLSFTEQYMDDQSLKLFLENEIAKPFDLAKDHMLRIHLLKLSGDEYSLLITTHHIASDGWSLSVVVREFIELYTARKSGRAPMLLPLAIQYADYAVWQRRFLNEETLNAKINYWVNKLHGVEALRLPSDFKMPAVKSNKGKSVRFSLESSILADLNRMAKEENVTLFMLLLSVFKVLLFRYTGQTDVCVGTPIANRVQQETEQMIGFFVNTLALRSEVNGAHPFNMFLNSVKSGTLEAYSHQDVPFEKVVDKIESGRDMSRSPVFQVMFVLQNVPQLPVLEMDDVTLVPGDFDYRVSKFDLTFNVTESRNGLLIDVEYSTDLFNEARIERMVGHYRTLLRSVVADRTATVSTLKMLDEKEERQILVDFNHTEEISNPDQTLVSLFEAQVHKSPASTALKYIEEEISYKELDLAAERMAAWLQHAYSVNAGEIVGIQLPRSEWMVITMLGVLKSGAAFVPIDIDLPQARIDFMIADCGCRLVIDMEELEKFKSSPQSFGNANNQRPKPRDLAYCLYTSGTTGKPKGVLIQQAAICSSIAAMHKAFGLTAKEKGLQFASYSFDASIAEIFLMLLTGGELHILPLEIRNHPGLCLDYINANQITFAILPPVYLDTIEIEHFTTLRVLVSAGEMAKKAHFSKFNRRGKFVNAYGPTEVSICGSSYTADPHDFDTPGPMPIGKPIAGVKVYILDPSKQVTGIGLPGEIYIAGPGLAKGYLNNPELTRQKFVSNPFAAGELMYRTGDIGRWLSDGNIEYVGRADDQVKIRGMRVELNEIEQVLQTCAGINQSVVLLVNGANDTQFLAAFILSDHQYNKERCEAYLATQLPDYMIPVVWVELDELPVTTNGKVDKKYLASKAVAGFQTKEYVAPRNAMEQTMAAIWQSLLPVEKIGVLDNFFELGGHSLLVARLAAAIRDELMVEVSIREIFTYPTIAELVQSLATNNKRLLPPIVAVPRPARIPLSYAQERLYFIHQLKGSLDYHIPVVLKLVGDLDIAVFSKAFRHIVNRHESLRTCFKEVDGTLSQEIIPEDQWHVVYHDIVANNQLMDDLVGQELARPFNLSRDHMLRVYLIKQDENEHVLLLVMHHIASDGWSVSILVKEFAALYEAYSKGIEHGLPELAIQYADYAIWQNNLDAGMLDSKLAYWKSKLAGSEALDLPTDYPREAAAIAKSGSASIFLDQKLIADLAEIGKKEGTTLFMTLLSVFNVLLSKYSGQDDISIGIPIANRPSKETETLIGFFANTLVIRSKLQNNPVFTDVLRDIRNTCLEAYEYQDTPFEKVLEVVNPARDLNRNPLFQVFFNMMNQPREEIVSDDIIISPLAAGEATSKFDITVYISEKPDGVECSLVYNASLFTSARMDKMSEHYLELIRATAANPSARLDDLSLSARRKTTGKTANGDSAWYGFNHTVVDVFKKQVAINPGNIAVAEPGIQLTYASLDGLSDQFAHLLTSRDTGKRIGLCLPHDHTMAVAILGVLKSGKSYVPLETAGLRANYETIVAESLVKFVVCANETVALLPNHPAVTAFNISDLSEAPLQNAPAFVSQGSAEDEAYVLFTSGSTGRPKGVIQLQKNLLHFISQYTAALAIAAHDRLSGFSPYTYDSFNNDFYGSLLNGATYCPLPIRNYYGNKLQEWLLQNQITIWHSVPGIFRSLAFEWMRHGQFFPSLRIVKMTGEKVYNKDFELFKKVTRPGCRFVVSLGSTEATLQCINLFSHDDVVESVVMPVGFPVDRTNILIVDKDGNDVSDFGIGEIVLQTEFLTPGYLDSKAQPGTGKTGAHFFKTGDIGKKMDDGRLEWIRRKDLQLKINGIRFEPGEVENNILGFHAGISAAVVKMNQTQEGKQLVCACYTSYDEIETEELKSYLLDRIPASLVPQVFMRMDEMPLTGHGKINRDMLPMPVLNGMESEETFSTNTALQLLDIWSLLLNIDREKIKPSSNFFELGGHSLLATRIISLIRNELGVEISIKEIFLKPTIAQLAGFIDRHAEAKSVNAIGPQERPVHIPLSFAQERLWFIDKLQGSRQYHIPSVLRIKGEPDGALIEQAMIDLINRHEVLRTWFVEEDGIPYQQIEARNKWRMSFANLDGADEAAIQSFIQQEINRPFNLSRDHMIRATLVGVGPAAYRMVIVIHHIASDGWSSSLFVKEFAQLYASRKNNTLPVLPGLKIQYADYALWQRSQLTGPILEKGLGYWKKKLSSLEPLSFPTDLPHPEIKTSSGKSFAFAIPLQLADDADSFAKKNNITPFILLLTVFKVMLHRYSGQGKICVGTPVANRTHAELESLIGFFVNTLPLCSDLDNNPLFGSLLADVKTTTLEAYAHQHIPFEKIVNIVEQGRDLGRSPLFQVMFVLQNIPGVPTFTVPGIEVTSERYEHEFSRFDFAFHIVKGSNGYEIDIRYNDALFYRPTIEKMGRYYTTLLADAIVNPGQTISQLKMLDDSEQDFLLRAVNETQFDPSWKQKTISAVFTAQAQLYPHHTAISFQGKQLSYQELDRLSDDAALFLHERGFKKAAVAGICMERSFGMIISMLAILKAGGAYLPIDPDYPADRIRFMLSDTKAQIVFTGANKPVLFEDDHHPYCISIEAVLNMDHAGKSRSFVSHVSPNDLAYVVYTSGSSGLPKGVQIEHGSVINEIAFYSKTFGYETADRQLLLANFVFDASVEQILLPLLNAACLVLLSKEDQLDADSLCKIIEQEKITHFQATPSLLKMIRPGHYSKLKRVCSGGEPCPVALAESWQGHADFYNKYGPTETTINSSFYKYAPGQSTDSFLPIGKPIGNTKFYVLDEYQGIKPPGIPGELYISGTGVGRGYLNSKELTSRAFIENPFEKGTIIYRTGDFVKWLPDGNMYYIGRKDNQVKIRGHRIELSEIEKTIEKNDRVSKAVVIVKIDVGGNNMLVACLTVKQGFKKEELYAFLKTSLPGYMIPSLVIEIDSFPLTPTGKTDRKRLQDMQVNAPVIDRFEVPSNEIEMILIDIWKELLELQEVGINDNFFHIGGNSILAYQLARKMDKRMGISVHVIWVFEAFTIKKMAAKIQHKYSWRGGLEKELVETEMATTAQVALIKPANNLHGLFFCAPLGGILPSTSITGIVQMAPYLTNELSFYGVQTPPVSIEIGEALHRREEVCLDQQQLDASLLDKLVSECVEQILLIDKEGPYCLGGFCTGAVMTMGIARQLTGMGKKVRKIILIDPPTWVQDIKTSAISTAYTNDQIAWFVAKDLGWSTPIKLDELTKELNENASGKAWEIGASHLKKHKVLKQEIEPADLKQAFLTKFYNEKVLALFFAQQEYRYPDANQSQTLLLLVEDYHKGITGGVKAYLKENVFSGGLEIVAAPGTHNSIFERDNMKKWMLEVNQFLLK